MLRFKDSVFRLAKNLWLKFIFAWRHDNPPEAAVSRLRCRRSVWAVVSDVVISQGILSSELMWSFCGTYRRVAAMEG